MANSKSSSKTSQRRGKHNNRRRGTAESDATTCDDKFQQKGGGPETHKYNDVSWYVKNQQMLNDAASYSYNAPLGSPVGWENVFDTDAMPIGGTSLYVPGLMALRIAPTIGVSENSVSPANLAANNVYAYVRYMNSGAANYDQPDLMLYLLAMDSIYSFWNFCQRLYGMAATYSQYNKYMPRAYFNACGVDLDDMITNLADFRAFLNRSAAQITSFCVPATMPYFVRHSWLFSNIYSDSDQQKAQQYIFTPYYFYQYNETGSTYGGQLVMKPWYQASARSVAEVETFMQEMLDAVAYSEDIGIMSGDILKAYGNDKLFKLTSVPADYGVIPTYNEEVLNQIHNASIFSESYAASNTTYNITQDPNTGYLLWNPTLKNSVFQRKGAFVNMPWPNVTPENTMVGTRLTSIVKAVNPEDLTKGFNFVAVGSEFVALATIYTYDYISAANKVVLINNAAVFDISVPGTPTASEEYTNWARVGDITNFDWHPLIYVEAYNTTVARLELCSVVGDISNYTIISSSNLHRLHETALMSEFNVPQLGSF